MRLKFYFPDFYYENKIMLWFATIALCFSLMIRGVLDTSRYLSPTFDEWLDFSETGYNFFTFVFCDIVPICFQLSTLIFGYIRRKKETKYRLEVQRTQPNIEDKNEIEESLTTNTSKMSHKGSYFDPSLMVLNNSISDSSSALL